MTKTSPIFELKNVSLLYDRKEILSNLSVRFEHQKVTSILGPSGVGKSTLFKTLNRLNDSQNDFSYTGEILFNDQNIKNYNKYDLRLQAGMVFQNPVIYPISIFDNVIFGIKYLKLAPKRQWQEIVEKALNQVHLLKEVKDRLKDNGLNLSQGQQQRLCFARILTVNPKALLLDEPTASLDELATEKLEKLIVELKKDISIVLVSHNKKQVQKISDHILEFKKKTNKVTHHYI